MEQKDTNKQDLPKEDTAALSQTIKEFLSGVFELRSKVDKTLTVKKIKDGISFKGLQSYILMVSIVIACIGLQANSTAVVIGAMLISPLMGPIIGIGYSLAVNDSHALKKSFQNFVLMMAIALIISSIFFYLMPIKSLTAELRGRLEPTFLDVLIAISGGFAGIGAASSKNENVNVIAGVAIATALMPPLCTAGYGLAVGFGEIGYKGYNGFSAFINALYLFFINSIFIAISTFVFIKFLRFPMVKHLDKKREKITNRWIVGISILVMIPSAYLFYKIIREAQQSLQIQQFLNKEVVYNNAFISKSEPIIDKTDSLTIINISSTGTTIPNEVIQNWNYKLQQKTGTSKTILMIHQGIDAASFKSELGTDLLRDLYRTDMLTKDSLIISLNTQINRLRSDSIPFRDISQELKGLYPDIENFGYTVINYTDFKRENSIPAIIIKWESGKNETEKQKDIAKIESYLKIRLKLDTIQVLNEK